MYNGSGEGGGGDPPLAQNGSPYWPPQQHNPMQHGGPSQHYLPGNGNGSMSMQHSQGHVAPPTNLYARPPPQQQALWGPAAMFGGQQSPSTGPGQQLYSGPPPAFISSNAQVPIGTPVHTTVFVGTISSGVTDEWITQVLNACGPLRSFKRVNASFGFAEFIDAESVLRALAVLAGMELPVMGREAVEKGEARKKLTVKADEKTRNYLNQYEQGRMKTHDHEQDESTARSAVQAIVTQMSDPSNIEMAESMPSYNVPSHLKDLPPEDLPEEHRGAVLSEIDKFRQSSAVRDEEKRRRDRMREMERIRASSANERTGGPSSQGRPSDGAREFDANDRQSYSRPVGFVASEQAQEERNLPVDERDAREAERKRQREQDEEMRAAQEAERRFLAVERSRLAHWDRVMVDEQADEERRSRSAHTMRQTFELWNQEHEAERDLFYVDRARWRAVRKPLLEREREEDELDRAAQTKEEERARIETERFLAQQAEEMAAFEREQRAAGVLMPNEGIHAPLKLKRVLGTAATNIDDSVPHPVTAGVLGAAEDDGDISGMRKGRLTHIDLTDEQTKKHHFRDALPKENATLFAKQPEWDSLDVAAHEDRYKALLDGGIVESLGEPVPDMVDELMSKLKMHVSASELIEVVEPVLEEEAEPLIRKLWIELLVDTSFAGVRSGAA